ncbi:MAG: sulfite oxidase [Gemmatimonadaceae bacterium]|nr:sulfite oxidase [Gemmatimonadaceae bacterium]
MTTPHARLIHDEDGLNSGVWPVLAELLVTPVESFFHRSHAPIPRIDPASWRLEIDGLVERPQSFSLDDLVRAFPVRNVVATLVCAGLRRDELLSVGALPGELPWGPEAASTGDWTGIALRAVLEAAGVRDEARHVEFTGLDQVERNGRVFGFGASIDVEKALADEVILATALNGAPLPAEHGFPLRAVVPGWIGARSVKWLGRITLRADPSPNYFQSAAYRVQREADPSRPRDVSAGIPLRGVPVNAVILHPTQNEVVPAGRLELRGWAMGSEGRPVAAVEVSSDDGHEWIPARISIEGPEWTWSMWEASVDLPPGHNTLVVRATDVAGATQPSTVEATWNVKGYCNNAWHRVAVRAE